MRPDQRFETIPLSEVPNQNDRVRSNDPVSAPPVVLVVDDEEIITNTRSAILSGWGYEVVTAYSAEQALRITQTVRPSYLVSDIQLNRTNGVDLAFAVRNMATDCQVILFSGEADSLALLATARNSRHDFTLLQKPIHPTLLRSFFPVIEQNA
jgi:DNA-binding NtrC family response regulator